MILSKNEMSEAVTEVLSFAPGDESLSDVVNDIVTSHEALRAKVEGEEINHAGAKAFVKSLCAQVDQLRAALEAMTKWRDDARFGLDHALKELKDLRAALEQVVRQYNEAAVDRSDLLLAQERLKRALEQAEKHNREREAEYAREVARSQEWCARAENAEGEIAAVKGYIFDAKAQRDEFHGRLRKTEAELAELLESHSDWKEEAPSALAKLDELRLRHATDAIVTERPTRPVTSALTADDIRALVDAKMREVLAEFVKCTDNAAAQEYNALIKARGEADDLWRGTALARDAAVQEATEQRHLEMGAFMLHAAQLRALTHVTDSGTYSELSAQELADRAKKLIAACREPREKAGRTVAEMMDAELVAQEEEHYRRKAVELDAKLLAAIGAVVLAVAS